MNWKNLKEYRCPDCNNPLIERPHSLVHKCLKKECGFMISTRKFDFIIRSGDRKRPVVFIEDENLSRLNNLGHDIVKDNSDD